MEAATKCKVIGFMMTGVTMSSHITTYCSFSSTSPKLIVEYNKEQQFGKNDCIKLSVDGYNSNESSEKPPFFKASFMDSGRICQMASVCIDITSNTTICKSIIFMQKVANLQIISLCSILFFVSCFIITVNADLKIGKEQLKCCFLMTKLLEQLKPLRVP